MQDVVQDKLKFMHQKNVPQIHNVIAEYQDVLIMVGCFDQYSMHYCHPTSIRHRGDVGNVATVPNTDK